MARCPFDNVVLTKINSDPYYLYCSTGPHFFSSLGGPLTYLGKGTLPAITAGGTAGTGVTAIEYGDAYNHVSVLTVSQIDALTVADNLDITDGYLVYTFPTGVILVEATYISMAVTVASAQQVADQPDVGLGTVIGSGANALLSADGTFENLLTGQTAADSNGTATVATAAPTAGVSFAIETGEAHTVHFNVADGWANDTGGDLTADITGTIILVWKWLV